MAPTPKHDGHAASEYEEHPSGVLFLQLPLYPPSTMTLDRKVWREAVREATFSYGEIRCIGLYLTLLLLGITSAGGAFVFLQWLLDRSGYAWWAWVVGTATLGVGVLIVMGLTRWLLKGPRRHLALVLEVRGVVLCGKCGYRIEGLEKGGKCPECGSARPLGGTP
ncbi:MAG: hypothetical protein ACIAQF_00980 [Phycisphaerales bacterium JB065]